MPPPKGGIRLQGIRLISNAWVVDETPVVWLSGRQCGICGTRWHSNTKIRMSELLCVCMFSKLDVDPSYPKLFIPLPAHYDQDMSRDDRLVVWLTTSELTQSTQTCSWIFKASTALKKKKDCKINKHYVTEKRCRCVTVNQAAVSVKSLVSQVYSLISSCLWMRPLQRSL